MAVLVTIIIGIGLMRVIKPPAVKMKVKFTEIFFLFLLDLQKTWTA